MLQIPLYAIHSADGQWPETYFEINEHFLRQKCSGIPKSTTRSISNWAYISFAEGKTEDWEIPWEQAGDKYNEVKAWQINTREFN